LLVYLYKPPQAGRGRHVFGLLEAFADLRIGTERAVDTARFRAARRRRDQTPATRLWEPPLDRALDQSSILSSLDWW
jgi:hypothetical protein